MYAMVDYNSFYCSCERLFNPALGKRPVIVLSNNDGCVVSRTDEAVSLGIAMGTPERSGCARIIFQSIILQTSMNYLKSMSHELHSIRKAYACAYLCVQKKR